MEGIKWIPLRLNNLPLVHMQTEKILDQVLVTREEVLEGDILGLETLKGIQRSVAERIREVDNFYLSRPLDPRMRYIYGVRSILLHIQQGCLQFEKTFERYHEGKEEKPQTFCIDSVSRNYFDPQSQQISSIKLQSAREKGMNQVGNKHSKPQMTPTHRPKGNQGQQQHYLEELKHQERPQENMKLSDLRSQNSKKKGKSPLKAINQHPKKGSGKKVEIGPIKKPQQKPENTLRVQRQKRQTTSKLESDNQIKKSFRDLSQLVFTIKMTKDEYNDFMQLKRKNNHA